ncbi:MAG: DNA-directed RNA polymerase subunit beta' [Bacilli bacterium]
MFELNNFDSIRIGIASPERIREWSYGEVTNPETINYRTQKPVMGGLFCERIFGPRKDWECACGKYKRIRYKGVICDRCGVEITKSKVRRERMGHIELATPVSHIWFFKSVPSRIGGILDITPKNLEQVLYYVNFIVLDPKETDLLPKQIITDREYRELGEKIGYDKFRVGMGADAIKELLQKVDLESEAKELFRLIKTAKGQKKLKAAKKLEIVQSFIKSGNKPEWMILLALPVLPPELRPMVQLDGGRFATSDLNDLYRRVINRNNRLKKLMELGAPDVIIRNEKRMLQEAVDSLIDNGKRGKPVTGGVKARELKSLTSMLKGKQGRFRQNLLGKRVDYSGRSVIVVGPELKIYQCGVPREMALELFKPFIMKRLVELNEAQNIKSAKRLIDKEKPVVWDVLEEVIKDHPVLLNRAPTLHRLGIQAFEPVLVDGRAIKLHPLVCIGFNADFDGDQMPIHVPLSIDARTEARLLMLSANNVLKPSDGSPVVSPERDIVLGIYYITIDKAGELGEGSIYSSEDEAIMAYELRKVALQSAVKLKREVIFNGEKISGVIETTVGRIIFNRCIPQNLGLVDRSTKEGALQYEANYTVGKSQLSAIIAAAFSKVGQTETIRALDRIKDCGFKYCTIASITISVFDMEIPKEKKGILEETAKAVLENEKLYSRGFVTHAEKANKNIELWNSATEKLKKIVIANMDRYNDLKMMADSKARANPDQISQMCGMRGIMANPSGEKVDIPIKANFREGMTTIEYFMAARGARKGVVDTALKTADSGYLTRRLVDVAQDVVVTEEDCFASLGEKVKGMVVHNLNGDNTLIETLSNRISGRFTVNDIVNPKTKQIIVNANEFITPLMAKQIEDCGIKEVEIRTLLTCKCKHGVCAKCYGRNMAGNETVNVGEAVGVIAAQSIGEPGTQLTMRTFHTGGVATAQDITGGLPRVEEIFEARKPKDSATISEISGRVTVKEVDKRHEITIKSKDGEEAVYLLAYGKRLKVTNGDFVNIGDALTEGSLCPTDILRTRGVRGVQEYLIKEVLGIYRKEGVAINAKHVEIIVRQMLKKVLVEDAGDTTLLPGEMVDITDYEIENKRMMDNDLEPATARRILLGIRKASLTNNSFLAAAAFENTSSVLTAAAINGKVDPLLGLKENVIIGKLIPAGTGLRQYRSINIKSIESSVKQHMFSEMEANSNNKFNLNDKLIEAK